MVAEEMPVDVMTREMQIGKETMKQYMAAANLLQRTQHCMLYGDLTVPRLTGGTMTKLMLQRAKRLDNRKKITKYTDAAASEFGPKQ